MAATGGSPSTSPRLPSPPPLTEVQIGPQSPTISDGSSPSSEEFLGPHDDSSTRRIRPGTKAADMAFGPPLVPLSQLDSPFQLQEHLKALYHNYTRPPGSLTIAPITRKVATKLAEPPEGVERSLWLYELCRFLTMKANSLIVAFFAENPPCSAKTCPEMRASEWQYLCAVHDPPKACCAIDYCCHTLDWATNILTSPKYFPSRLTLGSDASGGPQTSMKHLTNIFRRVYRIFAHAWFQHREVFWQVEGTDGLYVFFKTVCDIYNLIPEDNYTVPSEAEGEDAPAKVQQGEPRKVMILRKDDTTISTKEEVDPMSLNAASTTRRHRYSPSRPGSVTTITEAAEDDEDNSKDISYDEISLGIGSMQLTESPTNKDMEISLAESESTKASMDDKARADLDNTPSNFPSVTYEKEKSQDTSEDVGFPGTSERHPESVVVISSHPDEDKGVPTEPKDPSNEQKQIKAEDDENCHEQKHEPQQKPVADDPEPQPATKKAASPENGEEDTAEGSQNADEAEKEL
ncbi:hypothetical protein VTO42DRAFT_7642 [Malbranchea cinnamomea]